MVAVPHVDTIRFTNIIQSLTSPHKWTLPVQDGLMHISYRVAGAEDNFRMAVRSALSEWSGITNLVFNEVTGPAQIRFDITDLSIYGALGGAYYPVSNSSTVMLDDRYESDSFLPGNQSYHVLLHEVGHALGLKHANISGVVLGWAESDFYHNVTDRTIMNAYASSGPQAASPMSYDIWAMQQLYGRNITQTSGNDVYAFDGFTSMKKTIYDAGGIDTFSAINSYANSYIDLEQSFNFTDGEEHLSKVGGTYVWIDSDTMIENAIGGAWDDSINGNRAANSLDGGAGNDTIYGGSGNDSLIGGNGNDTLYGDEEQDILRGGNGRDYMDGGSGNDKLYGESDNDFLQGREGNDVLAGSTGNDTLAGESGRDALSGGAGADIYWFSDLAHSTSNLYDTIIDFEDGIDLIDMRGTGLNHFTAQAITLEGELRANYDSAGNRTFIQTDQQDFRFALTGDHVSYLSDMDFLW